MTTKAGLFTACKHKMKQTGNNNYAKSNRSRFTIGWRMLFSEFYVRWNGCMEVCVFKMCLAVCEATVDILLELIPVSSSFKSNVNDSCGWYRLPLLFHIFYPSSFVYNLIEFILGLLHFFSLFWLLSLRTIERACLSICAQHRYSCHWIEWYSSCYVSFWNKDK